MNTILFTWNPKKWPWNDLPQAVSEANVEGKHVDTWSCGVTRNIKPGDRAFLMRLGVHPKGIMGSGIVTSEPRERAHWDPARAAKGDSGFYVKILFDALNYTPLLKASGTFIPKEVANHLESLWSNVTGTKFVAPRSDGPPTIHLEGTRRTKLITSCERNPEARSKCIEYYGAKCMVCGMSFEERYGEIGDGFIHVHHLVQMAEINEEYEVDPIKDLRPLCPNCHAMVHKRLPQYTIEELIQIMNASKAGSRGS